MDLDRDTEAFQIIVVGGGHTNEIERLTASFLAHRINVHVSAVPDETILTERIRDLAALTEPLPPMVLPPLPAWMFEENPANNPNRASRRRRGRQAPGSRR